MSKALVWFRNDLRIEDHAALYHASQDNEVIGIYFEATKQRVKHFDAKCKIGFTYDCLLVLREKLDEFNIPLHIIIVDTFEEIPSQLTQLALENDVESIWFNNEYLLNELSRDKDVEAEAKARNIIVKRFDNDMVLSPSSVTKPDGEPYKVFTPFKKAWIKQHKQINPKPLPAPKSQSLQFKLNELNHDSFAKKYRDDLWPAGFEQAQRRLKQFLSKVEDYKKQRDIPSRAGTSLLSPYLAVGALSTKQCATALYDYYHADEERFYQDTWLSELVWREFYRQIIIDQPQLVKHKPFKPSVKEPWQNNHQLFEAWSSGMTGFPIIDAAMRQLNQTGWMHNRLRMNAAMFLCKLCLIDWRWGEKYFMQNLIDGDFASNNGGWQWCSSTGADGAPYFRIMNPTVQSERFDPNGDFIRKFVPELSKLDAKDVHNPSPEQRKQYSYPDPIIDYKAARKLTIELMG